LPLPSMPPLEKAHIIPALEGETGYIFVTSARDR
jgi:hypothetical protein